MQNAPCLIDIDSHSLAPAFLPAEYALQFLDHFDRLPGAGVDAALWNTALPWGPSLTINGEEQYYPDVLNGDLSAPNPFRFDGDSSLVITAGLNSPAQAAATGKEYYSGVLTGFGKTDFRYGYISTRAKLPEGNQGLWSAFWLLNRFYRPGAGATGANGKYETEIDWEFVRGLGGAFGGGPYDTFGAPVAYHYDGGQWKIDGNGFTGPGGAPGVSQQCNGAQLNNVVGFSPYPSLPSGADLAADFHEYGIWWEEGFIRWMLDGVEVFSICDPAIVSQIVMYPIINQAVGGNFPGPALPADYAGEGAEMLVDYVCLFQRPQSELVLRNDEIELWPKYWTMPSGARRPVPVY